MKVWFVNAFIALSGVALYECGYYIATTEAVKLESWFMFCLGIAFQALGIFFVVWAFAQVAYYTIKGKEYR